jgi:hypothetical protein
MPHWCSHLRAQGQPGRGSRRQQNRILPQIDYHGADNSLTTVGADRLVESDPSHGPVILATKRLNPKIGLQLSEVLPASLPALRIVPRCA